MKVYKEYQTMKLGAKKRSPTSPDIEGPFYKADAPVITTNKLVDNPTLALHGRIIDVDGNPIVGAVLDWWQANADGEYDNVGFKLRGKQLLNGAAYYLATVRPGNYAISDKEYRCAHIHVKVNAPGCKPLTTQLYFADDRYDKTDHWFDASRCLSPNGEFDFVMEKLEKKEE